jgi:hypothetical protein
MGASSDIETPASSAPSTPVDATREARRAQALRANLRRRKAAPATPSAREP